MNRVALIAFACLLSLSSTCKRKMVPCTWYRGIQWPLNRDWNFIKRPLVQISTKCFTLFSTTLKCLINFLSVNVPLTKAVFRCHRKIDMVILLDSSASTTRDQFADSKRFASDLVKHFEISKDKTNVAAVSFSQYTDSCGKKFQRGPLKRSCLESNRQSPIWRISQSTGPCSRNTIGGNLG